MSRTSIAQCSRGSGELFIVRKGDSISKLINEAKQQSLTDHGPFIDQVLQDNPHIESANLIYPGQVIFIRTDLEGTKALLPKVVEGIRDSAKAYSSVKPEDASVIEAIAPFAKITMDETIKHSRSSLEKAAIASRKGLEELLDIHQPLRQQGFITSSHFLKRSQVIDATSRAHAGPLKRVLGKGPLTSLRTDAMRGRTIRKSLEVQAQHASRVAKIAKAGGYVMTAVNLGMTCHDIAHAKTNGEKNGLFVETASSMGAGATVAAGVLLVTGPVGWGVALVIGIGSGVAGWAAGRGARKVYDEYGKGYDVVGAFKVDKVCNIENFDALRP